MSDPKGLPDEIKRPAASDGRFAELLLRALRVPLSLQREDGENLLAALRSAEPSAAELALGALAALALARADLLSTEPLGTIFTAGESESLPAILEGLTATAAAPLAAEAIWRLFTAPPAAGLRRARVDLLRQLALWRPDLVTLDRLTAIGAELDLEERERCLAEILEPLLLRAPGRLDGPAFASLAAAFAATRQWSYTLSILALDRRASPALQRAAARVADRFAWRRLAAQTLGGGPFHLLVVFNVSVGQGDEMIRLGPLLQGLLAAHPALTATVLTPRPYLYEHPRLRALSLFAVEAVAALLAKPCDGLVNVFEPVVPEMILRPELEPLLRQLAAEPGLRLLVRGDVASGHCTFREVILAGENLTERLRLHHRPYESVYGATRQLVLEFGLPWLPAAGLGSGSAGDPYTGIASDDAARLWTQLAGHLEAGKGRPVALLWPYGGRAEIKGFTRDQVGELAREIADLVAEGFRVVLLPPGTAWVRSGDTERLLAVLPRDTREHVVLAPDPAADAKTAAELALHERPDLPHADRIMRLFLHFAVRADLVVTVEGWLAHFAAQLGRPLRLVVMAGSFSPDWYPPGPAQMAERLAPPTLHDAVAPVLDPGGPPPLLRRARRGLLAVALRALAEAPGEAAEEPLSQALASPDVHLRVAAVQGLGGHVDRPTVIGRLVGCLNDPEAEVRRAAAEELLAAADRGYDAAVRRPVLLAHRDVARQQWEAVLSLNQDALPALAVAAVGEPDAVRREARRALAWILGQRSRARRQAESAAP